MTWNLGTRLIRICLAFRLDRLRQNSVSDPDLTLGMIIGLSSVFIREVIDQEFAGEKSTIDDETIFQDEEDLNKVIEQNEKKGIKAESQNMPKAKKKKRFFFF